MVQVEEKLKEEIEKTKIEQVELQKSNEGYEE